jgi:undecaprenyl pyrophosphate phosphatase UppP
LTVPLLRRTLESSKGLTEFLPVSSTAHLLLGEKLLGFDDPMGIFTVMIQLGSILAIVWLYRVKILHVLTRCRPTPMLGASLRPSSWLSSPRSLPVRCCRRS